MAVDADAVGDPLRGVDPCLRAAVRGRPWGSRLGYRGRLLWPRRRPPHGSARPRCRPQPLRQRPAQGFEM